MNWLRAHGVWLVLLLVVVSLTSVFIAYVPDPLGVSIATTTAILVVGLTAVLVLVTAYYAYQTWKTVAVMDRQASLIEEQVKAADKQRRATIRPIIMFRNDFADPAYVQRQRDRHAEWQERARQYVLTRGTINADTWEAPGDEPRLPGATLVNVGNGVALNVVAVVKMADGPSFSDWAPSIGAGGPPHFVTCWYSQLESRKVESFTADYEDAEGVHYRTKATFDGAEWWDVTEVTEAEPIEAEGP